MNLGEYFERIGFQGPFEKPDLATLKMIHKQHVMSIPFENLSIHCGEEITMDIEQIYSKIVRSSRGGWCCENNLLFAWVLKEMGYDPVTLGSRLFHSITNESEPLDSHLINKVIIDGTAYIADVSFGVSCQIWHPLELVSGKDQPQSPGVFRLTEHEGTWALEKTGRTPLVLNEEFANSGLLDKSLTKKIYCFTLEPRGVNHFLETCHFLQTDPSSLFTNKSICSLQTATGFRALIGWTFSEITFNFQEGVDVFDMKDISDDQVEKVLKEKFNVLLVNKLVPKNNKASYKM